ncbi:MAG TPA: hypothetical protein VJT74_10395 [Pyrinomonadaceae bacterium]|nr:hypothetical protein [Pyrinomonadaceae bacterium]
MPKALTPAEADNGWVIAMTPEMARMASVPAGSQIVFYVSEGKVSAEILPPAPPEIDEFVERMVEKHHDAFEEMKRLGD